MAEVLVLDTGGRGRAIEQAMAASSEVSRVVVASTVDQGIGQFTVGAEKPLVILGNEAFAVDGVADDLRADGYTVLGATKEQAQYEASKSTAVRMMGKDVDHPDTHISHSLAEEEEYIENHDPADYVIKGDGLGEGKAVILPDSQEEALEEVRGMRLEGRYLEAGTRIINFAGRWHGPEISDIAIVGDRDEHFHLAITQDHKRVGDGDTGRNTGGMGAYGPVPESVFGVGNLKNTYELKERSLWAMRKFGIPYGRAALYTGIMIARENTGKPGVLEYNVRLGDPEANIQLALAVKAGIDCYRLLRSAAEGDLEKPDVDFAKLSLAALSVCLASKGYPQSKTVDEPIWGLDRQYPGVTIQEAAVKDGKTNGGRVLYVTAVGSDIDEAARLAYAAIDVDRVGPDSEKIGFSDMQFRKDIGWQARTAA